MTTSAPNLATARSFLFVPGDRSDRFDKAAAAGAHVVIIDLEDAVAADRKTAARTSAAAWLSDRGRAVVRINSDGEDAADDLAALANLNGLIGVMLPKAESAEQVGEIRAAVGDVPIIALIETAAGIAAARDVARAPGVVRLAIGSLDLAVDLEITEDSRSMASARWEIVLASRLAELPAPVDTVTAEIGDGSASRQAAERARMDGFTGKLCIHPAQVLPVNSTFAPTEDEVSWAARVIEASRSDAVASVDGAMVDKPVIERARRILAESERGQD